LFKGVKMYKKIKIIALIFILMVLQGCQSVATDNTSGKATVILSEDFGHLKTVESVKLPREETALEVTQRIFEVKTAYNGGFVNSIDGQVSGYTNQKRSVKKDWFYYINGTAAVVGAGDYFIDSGDVIQWDFHQWDNGQYSQVIIGAYPKNFTKGYEGQQLPIHLYSNIEKKFISKSLSKELALEKAHSISSFDESDMDNSQRHTIIIGSWSDLKDNQGLKEILVNYKKWRLPMTIENNVLKLFSWDYSDVRSKKTGAIIVATQKSYGALGTLWLVIALDDASLEAAVDYLSKDSEALQGFVGAYITKDTIVPLPIEGEK